MSFLGKDSSEILVAGCQSTMYKIDVEKGIVLQEVDFRFLDFFLDFFTAKFVVAFD